MSANERMHPIGSEGGAGGRGAGDAAAPVTYLLDRMRAGDASAVERLLPLIYDELRGLAGRVFSGQNPAHTLQPTALVHEAWIKLAGNLDSIEDRQHFLVLAGKAMRQVIANHARDRLALKRGGGVRRVSFDTSFAGAARDDAEQGVDLIDLDQCLTRLAERNERHARVAELRLFSGLSIDEVAAALEVSPRTVDADWAMAKAWLIRALGGP